MYGITYQLIVYMLVVYYVKEQLTLSIRAGYTVT